MGEPPQALLARTLQHYPEGVGQARGVSVEEVDHPSQPNRLAQEVAEVGARCSVQCRQAEGQAAAFASLTS